MRKNPYTPARQQGAWKPTLLFWIVAAVLLLVLIPFAVAGGLGMVLFILGLISLLTGLYAWLFKRRSWIGLPHRKSGGLVAVAGFVALIVGFGVVGATAAPRTDGDEATTLAGSVQESAAATPTATPTATNPAKSICTIAGSTQKYNGQTFVCTTGNDQRLVWLTEADSKKALAEKAAADKAVADKAAADLAAAEKEAADQAAANQAAAAQAAAEQAAAEQAAQEAAARQAAEQAAAEQAAAAQAAQQQAAQQAPAVPAPSYVHPGSFCSGGTGVSKTGKPMVCAPATDGRLRWQGA